jgi:hypothetical protein
MIPTCTHLQCIVQLKAETAGESYAGVSSVLPWAIATRLATYHCAIITARETTSLFLWFPLVSNT